MAVDIFEPDYGTDISCLMDIDPLGRVVSGTEMMAQACVRRLICRKGSLLSDPLYGIDVRDYLNARIDAAALSRIPAVIQGELLRDERVFTVNVTVSYSQTAKALTIDIKGVGAPGPFALTLSVKDGQVTVEILSPI